MNEHCKNCFLPLLFTASFPLLHPYPSSQSAVLHPIASLVREREPQFLSTPSSLSLFALELLGLWSVSGVRTWILPLAPDPGFYICVA